MGYIFTNNWIYLAKIMGYSWDIFGKKYGIYWDKTIGYFKGFMRQKLWDILLKNYGIYYGLYLTKNERDIFVKLRDLFRKTMGYSGQTLWHILWYTLVKNCWIYLSKLWDILVHWIY